jgi:hypothetical protein
MAKLKNKKPQFADINILQLQNGDHEIVVCMKIEPEILIGEGSSKSILAIDSSRSIKEMFGGGLFGANPNYVQSISQKVGELLVQVSSEAKLHVFYWAVGRSGEKIEVVGDIEESDIPTMKISGPKIEKWGGGTQLLPTLIYINEMVSIGIDLSIVVIVTDGLITDEISCLDYCNQIAEKMINGEQSNNLKLILIGVGNEVDADQLERFDNMFEGTQYEDHVDLWSHGIAESITDENEIMDIIFGELITEDMIVAPKASIELKNGQVIQNFYDGLPGKFRFILPKGESKFFLKTDHGIIEQSIID